jgi:hypothetical protein
MSLTPVYFDLQIPQGIFEKIRNDPNAIIRGLGEDDSRKKPEAKTRDTVPLSCAEHFRGKGLTCPFLTTGRSKTPCMPRMADWGGLIIGVPNREPNTPPLLQKKSTLIIHKITFSKITVHGKRQC